MYLQTEFWTCINESNHNSLAVFIPGMMTWFSIRNLLMKFTTLKNWGEKNTYDYAINAEKW